MSIINRQTIIFFLPLEMGSFTNDQNPFSATNSDGGVTWDKRQLYMNPQSFNMRERKYIKSDLTKGGFVTQYWGEELTTIEVSGITGASGVEGINVLRDIYRHEQIQYRRVLEKRQRELAAAAEQAAKDAAESLSERTGAWGTFSNVADTLTGGAFTSTVDGLGNAVDMIFDTGSGTSLALSGSGAFSTIPTLAAFATNIDMYYQGEFYRGYFSSFSSTENANEPGHFSYQFSFTVTRRSGRRENFMPWHREAVSVDGETMMSQKTTESKGVYPGNRTLSFPDEVGSSHGEWSEMLLDPSNSIGAPGYVSSTFSDPDDPTAAEGISVEINRNASITGSSS
jgi:hypothetical protein